MMVLGDIAIRNAKRYPQKTALVFGDIRYTFKEFNSRVNSLANALLSIGLSKGDRVAVLSDSCSQYAEIYFALAKGGMVAVPLNCALGVPELSYLINHSEANLLIFGANYKGVVSSMRSGLEYVKNFISLEGGMAGAKSYEEIVSSHPTAEPQLELDEDDLSMIAYTSGTTGLPKGVMWTHKNMLANAINMILAWDVKHNDVALHTISTSWAAWPWFLLPYFYVGAKVVLDGKFEPEAILELIEREKITHTFFAPSAVGSLLECRGIGEHDLSSLRYLVYSGEPMPLELMRRALRTFGNVLVQIYGNVEAPSIACLSHGDHAVDGSPEKVGRLRSCGREVVNVDIRIVDEEGRDVPPGEVGELVARGDNVTQGYWKQLEATAEVLKGGYFYTGDLATVDEEGYIYLLDRKKDAIKSGGKFISSREVEDVLCSHPLVREAAVIGIPDEELGEVVKAVAVLRKGEEVSEGALIEHCRRKMEGNAVPRSVEFLEQLPRNPSGKVLKRVLRKKYRL